MTRWPVTVIEDPLPLKGQQLPASPRNNGGDVRILRSNIVHVKVPISDVVGAATGRQQAFEEGGRVARVALADYVSRLLSSSSPSSSNGAVGGEEERKNKAQDGTGYVFRFEKLDKTQASTLNSTRRRKRSNNSSIVKTPFILERTDVWCDESLLHVFLRVLVHRDVDSMVTDDDQDPQSLDCGSIMDAASTFLRRILFQNNGTIDGLDNTTDLMNHVATAVLQDRLRSQLSDLDAVAFVNDGAILPRRSGASSAPMASPPAVPFQAPGGSPMARSIEVEMGNLRKYLSGLPETRLQNGRSASVTAVALSGLLIPRGVTLIVGGGYHGKSTLLRTIASGVYNKVPGDGREFSVTVNDAVTVRAEDGRYVNNCNVSAFISNLPTPPGVTKQLDTTHFSSGEASGSTSQAANVVEAIEMGAKAFLVDEDVSAANFMARDGRMRSLVMDESITPFLYRVNGLYQTRGISSIVVVGGVGDWLDVPNAVVLMDKYLCKDATAKAHSVSKQFSHGHVQYAGRGVVHRLPWDNSGTPIPRRPSNAFAKQFSRTSTAMSLLDGSDALAFHPAEHLDEMGGCDCEADTEEDFIVDLSRCEQLMGKKPQLYGCGASALWLLEASQKHPDLGLPDLLKKLDEHIDKNGFSSVFTSSDDGETETEKDSTMAWKLLIESAGCACRPRRYEVGHALTRLRGIELEEIPIEDDGVEAAAKAEAERKKQAMLEMWNKRRKNKLNEND